MSAEMCTSEQAIAACSYLNNSFGGYPMTIDERRPYLRLFRNFSPAEVAAAIDRLARTWSSTRRPMPNDVARCVLYGRPRLDRSGPFLDEIPLNALTPSSEVSDRIARLRELANDPMAALEASQRNRPISPQP